MSEQLSADMNIIQSAPIELELLDGDLNIIQALDDEPNDVGGLTSAELKAKFDESGNIIKKYINETLIPAVLAEDATEESRKQAEAQRETNEEQRIENENARIAAEDSRSTAESGRVTAEEARAAAEQARADENTGIVARATEQADIASNEASSASNSASEALISEHNAEVWAEGGQLEGHNGDVVLQGLEVGAKGYAKQAKDSASEASTSETNAKASEVSAEASQTAAAGSASAAANSATSASVSASAASESAAAAATSATVAKASEEAAKASETAAKASEVAAAGSVSAAQQSATSAAESAAVYDTVVADVNQLKQDLSFFGSMDKPGEETLVTGKMVISNGILSTQENSDAHTNIRVTRGTRIEISNAYCAYSRSICAYDKDGNFVKVLGTNLGTVPVTVEYDVDDYDFISVTSKAGESIIVRYVAGQSAIPNEDFAKWIDEKNATKDGTGNYIEAPEIQLDQSAFTDGYLAGNLVIAHTYYYYSDYIHVIDEQNIRLNNIFVGGFTVAVFYDSDKKYLTHIRHASTDFEISTTITVPYNAKYMRFTAKKSRDFSTIRVSYVDKIERNFKPLNLVNRWYYDSKGRINTLFAKAQSKPICCIIDDDSLSATYMEIFAALMEENGISGTIACLTKVMDENEDLKTKLLELERRGHQVVLHGYTQNEAYKNASTIGDANYKIAEDDFVHGLRDLMTAGFVDCKFWVSPYGVAQECLQDMARKWGMECLITSAKKEFNGSDGKFGRYEIQRSGLNAYDTGTLTQEQLLALADQCADANGWLLINTHITDGWNGDFTRITDFISHCKEKGFEFMTLGDAWRIRKPIYDWYDTF